jgi:inner membrane protein
VEAHQNAFESAVDVFRSSHTVRLVGVGGLALLLLVPIVLIGALIGEREQRRDEAVAEVSAKWGNRQAIVGPVLLVPYTARVQETDTQSKTIVREVPRTAVVLPASLRAVGTLQAESRSRGIFAVPVYSAALELAGAFTRPPDGDIDRDATLVHWDRAQLAIGISDVRALQRAPAATWNGAPMAFLPGADALSPVSSGIHAPVNASAESLTFTVPLALNGSLGLALTPVGERTVVSLQSNSGNPSFQGAWLPTRREVSADRFTASWEIPFLGRNYPQVWSATADMKTAVAASQFGVDLVDPVDQYRMAERSVKYAILFILLTFGTVWLMEVLTGLRVHPIQYLLLGAALCIFYLLELSLAEHLGFAAAYVAAALAIVALIGMYGYWILGRAARAAGVAAGVAALYGYLYVLLMNEDYALLIGSIGLFAALAGVMFVTRRVDW